MKSRWYELKPDALKLRKQGISLRNIEQKLGIPRSTLSGWLQEVILTKRQRERLHLRWERALTKARSKAVRWHNAQKAKRLQDAENQALITLRKVDVLKKEILELTLALLYFGEGAKKNTETALGSSDPLILKFFLALIQNIYHIEVEKIRCELYIRADQIPKEIKQFWARELKLPLNCFKQVNIDKRTLGSKTYANYNGVCHIRCGNVAIQRKLLSLSKFFCEKVVNQYTGA
ncbi:MAG: hypothetical protein HYW95_00260 [Candidatus Wildermuthbacteria bacterium]|nr:hypothetical protein [Candidatus Wildermuthbacteria bacterium]